VVVVGCTGPAASSTFAAADFTSAVNMPGGGQVVIPREMFGIATAAALDNNFAVMGNSTFQTTARSLVTPLVRFNCNSGAGGGNIFSNTFPSGPHGFINNIGKCVDLTTTKIVIGVGFPGTGGLSNADFALMTSQVVSRLRTTVPAGGGSPIDPKIWEYLNEPSTVSSSGFNAFVDAVNGVAAGYTCTGPAGANDFGLLTTLVNGAGGRSFMGNEHAYLYCQGPDQKPSAANIAQAIPITGTSPVGFAGSINGTTDGHSVVDYFLSKATQKMPGRMVTTSLGGGAPNMAGWSTVGSSGNFGVYLHNWDGVAHTGPVGLSHWPVNTTGNGTLTMWQLDASNYTTGGVTTHPVASAGVLSSVTFRRCR
jgi:hypothetical protein